jgi:hypothetical protein
MRPQGRPRRKCWERNTAWMLKKYSGLVRTGPIRWPHGLRQDVSSLARTLGSNLNQGMDICLRLFCVCVVLCRWRPCFGLIFSPSSPTIGLRDVEAPTFSRQSAHRWRWGCQPYAPAYLYPQEDSWYSFLLEAESTPGSQCGWMD